MEIEAWTYEEWLERLRALVVLKAFWSDRRVLMEAALGPQTVQVYGYRPNTWPPTLVIANSPPRLEVYIEGVASYSHAYSHFAGLIGDVEDGGAKNSGDMAATRVVWDQYGALLAPPAPGQERTAVLYGHSRGGSVAQMLADRMVAAGWPAGRVRVVSFGGPRSYTAAVRQPAHAVDLIQASGDPVPFTPAEVVPYFTWELDPFHGWVPGPQLADPWFHRGSIRFIDQAGKMWDASSAVMPTGEPIQHASEGIIGSHYFDAYLQRLRAVAVRRGWLLDPRATALLALSDSVPGGHPPGKEFQLSVYLPGVPPDALGVPWEFGVFGSKGDLSVTTSIECSAYFRCGRYGWSESVHWLGGGETPTIVAAQLAFEALLTERVKIGHPYAIYKKHYHIDGCRYSWFDTDPTKQFDRRSYLDHDVTVEVPAAPPDSPEEKRAEFPWTGYEFNAWAGDSNRRTWIFRPIRNVSHQSEGGLEVDHTNVYNDIAAFRTYLLAGGKWGIKGIDPSVPKKVVTAFTWNAPAPNFITLTVPGHGYTRGQEVKVMGGKKDHKMFRGRHTVYGVTDDNNFVIDYKTPLMSMHGGPIVYPIIYRVSAITSLTSIGVRSRDTGAPTLPVRGRRRRRK